MARRHADGAATGGRRFVEGDDIHDDPEKQQRAGHRHSDPEGNHIRLDHSFTDTPPRSLTA